MANTTFNGPVRAEQGFKQITKNATTGAITDNTTIDSSGNIVAGGTATFAGIVDLNGNTMSAGTGITTGTGTVYAGAAVKVGGVYSTSILIDLTGLASSGSGDIIGKAGTANSNIGQITAANNGTILAGQLNVYEAPAGGDPDIDLWYADEATGAEDAAITGLSNQVQVMNNGDLTAGSIDYFTAGVVPAADKYLYLVTGAATNADYTAGRILLEMWGYDA
jgi:hypothetical protein